MSNVAPSLPASHVLVIFVGCSTDAQKHAKTLRDLKPELERRLAGYVKRYANGSPLRSVTVWTSHLDGIPTSGGQEANVNAMLDRANIAVFVFKDRIGKGTRYELERFRGRNVGKPLLTFFPRTSPRIPIEDRDALEQWRQVAELYGSLPEGWLDEQGFAVPPAGLYHQRAPLRTLASKALDAAIARVVRTGPGQEPSDEELLLNWRAGDEHAGRRLMKNQTAPLLRFFEAKIGDRTDLEGLVFDTFQRCRRAPEDVLVRHQSLPALLETMREAAWTSRQDRERIIPEP